MALSLGSSLADKIYLGATEVALAYFGATQVYTSSPDFSAEAQNYFDRLDTAGDTTYTAYKQPLANYIDGLVTLGGAYWDTMLSSTSFVGVGIQGVTVPLRDGMTVPTNNNFVASDLNQLTGLKGDGSTKYVNTGLSSSVMSLNDTSISVYQTTASTTDTNWLLGNKHFSALRSNGNMYVNGPVAFIGAPVSPSLYGGSRASSTNIDTRANGTTSNVANTSLSIGTADYLVFGYNSASSDARLATYHVGPALNLATIEGLQATLLSEIRTAHTFVAAASYFSRLAAAGDTAHVAYKQPLTNYITSLVELGGAYWDDMKSAASFVGVGIQGVTVPLRDGMSVPTNLNFVAGDLNQLTGLKGDGTTKRIDALPNMSGFSQDDVSMSAYQTELLTDQWLIGSPNLYLRKASWSTTCFATGVAGSFPNLGLSGVSRSSSTGYTYRTNNIDEAKTATSAAILSSVFSVFGQTGIRFSDGRIATYHAGPALNLTTLEALQDTLITEIAAI
jgi:hypothetical protein